jgi:hypothetical protein
VDDSFPLRPFKTKIIDPLTQIGKGLIRRLTTNASVLEPGYHVRRDNDIGQFLCPGVPVPLNKGQCIGQVEVKYLATWGLNANSLHGPKNRHHLKRT